MAEDRFRNYKYALVRFFRSRGYEVNSIKKTIKIDAYELNKKESERLKQLQNWGFIVIDPKASNSVRNLDNFPDFEVIDDYGCDYGNAESFIDFADEIIEMCKSGYEAY